MSKTTITIGAKLLLNGQRATVTVVSMSGRRTVVLARIDATGVEAWYYYNNASGYLTAL
jgi:hypothetical protein